MRRRFRYDVLTIILVLLLALWACAHSAHAQQFTKQNSTKGICFLLVSTTDGTTAVTGLTPTVTISKEGATSFSSAAGTVREIGNGVYELVPTSVDTGTLGRLLVHATGTGALPYDLQVRVVAFDPDSGTSLGLSNLDAAISTRSTYAGGDTSGTTTLLTRIPGTVAAQSGDAYARLGPPAGASVSADIAANSTTSGNIYSRIGAPSGASISADIASVYSRLGAPVGASLSADIAAGPAGVWAVGTRTITGLPTGAGAGQILLTSGKVTAGTLPSPAPDGYGGSGGGGSAVVRPLLNMSSSYPNESLRLTAGDTTAAPLYQLRDDAGRVVPLGGSETITFTLKKRGAGSAAVAASGSIEWAPAGWIKFEFSGGTPVPAAGDYDAVWQVSGQTYPVGRKVYVRIDPAL